MPVPTRVIPRRVEYPEVNFKKCMPCFPGESPLDLFDKRMVLGAVGLVGTLSALFHHVCNWADPLHTFVVGSMCVYVTYYALDSLLLRYVPRYQAIGNRDKQFYVLSNTIKSLVLASFTPFCFEMLRDALIQDQWNNTRIRNLGSLYAICDFVSLLVVKRMQWTTILHHLCVVVFNAFSIRNDYKQENVCRLIMVYAIFSTYAYLVNLLLASRFLRISDRLSAFLSYAAVSIYIVACSINWLWQAYYVRHLLATRPHYSVYVYLLLICFVVYDDIVLNRWLCQNAEQLQRRSSGEGQKLS